MINKCENCSGTDFEEGIMVARDTSMASAVSNIDNLPFDYKACKNCGHTNFFKRALVKEELQIKPPSNKKTITIILFSFLIPLIITAFVLLIIFSSII